MTWVREGEKVWMAESLSNQYDRPSVREEERDRKEYADVFGADPFTGLVNDAFAEQIQGVCARGREQITERGPWKLADRHVVW
jgi:hypothetical protein